MAKKYAILLALSVILTACAGEPPVLAIKRPNDVFLACRDIAREIQEAQYYKISADGDNRYSEGAPILTKFEWKEADDAAAKRINYLQTLYEDKKCHLSRFSRSYQQQMTPLPPYSL
ncbi:MAG: hypothetical protein K0R63_1074 [Rickettsiales bacterium]|jgi:hypothetical protein|nr:hypothetical protein [Rickettsiales bacterium]